MNYFIFSNGKRIKDSLFLKDFETEDVGIFESLRTYQGEIFRPEEHLRRFVESAKTVGLKTPDLNKVSKELLLALAAFQKGNQSHKKEDVFIRLTLWRDNIFVVISQRRHPESIYKKGVCLRTSPVKRSHSNASPPEVKTSAYQNAVLASLEPLQGEVYEWVFLDPNGLVTEVRIGNLFIVAQGGFSTPPTVGILNGVTRRFVIDCAREIKIPVKEIPLTRHDIFSAEEAFLTNTSWEILPVRELDGRRIGKRIPGPLCQKLQKVFKQKVFKECFQKPRPKAAFNAR